MYHTLVSEDVVTLDQNVQRIQHIRVHAAQEHTHPAMEVLNVILVQMVGRSVFFLAFETFIFTSQLHFLPFVRSYV